MINYNELLKTELQGVYGDYLARVSQINEWYKIYEGEQQWVTNDEDLDYTPTKKVTNVIKKLIDTRARFMFGREPFFDVRPLKMDSKEKDKDGNISTTFQDQAQAKEDLLYKIFEENKFHSKLLKARKDCSIGGKIAIKLWAHKDTGLKIIFSPAQEFFPRVDVDDVDKLEKITFLYALNNESDSEKQRIKKQVWEMVGKECILNESTHDGKGTLISVEYQDYKTGLDFIPVVIIQNGGLTGETEGVSDVYQLWDNQDNYNRIASDDIDALKFQMFGQDVATDASEDSLKNMKKAPGALVDLQTDKYHANAGRQASMSRLESQFSYTDKFIDTVDRLKNDMYDTMDVPNINLESLKGIITSGKSMKALYWGLMAVCDEDFTEWGPALKQMAEYIFRMVDIYNLYGSRQIAKYETTLKIELVYPIQEDEDTEKKIDMEEVTVNVRSRKSYIDKWEISEDSESELEQIQLEKQMLEDSYTKDLELDLEE